MNFQELVDFLENKMRLSHIYQPLLIRSLVEAGGSATLRQLACSFVVQDESQILYYEKKIKEMPLKVLKKHGVVQNDGDLVFLTTRQLTFEQKATVKMICERRLQEYVQKRGLSIWDYRLLDSDPVPDSLRYKVLKESGGRCALCGATKKEAPLDIDHIHPRSRHGKTELANLQVLCAKCNRSKGNKDETDFRYDLEPDEDPGCPFCPDQVKPRVIEELGTAIVIKDRYPVTDGHVLVLPRRHCPDFFSMSSRERKDAEALLRLMRNRILEQDPLVKGFNVGANCGETAGQTIMHAHIHLIPRRSGDTPDPRGGVRGVIPAKMSY